MHFFNIQRSCSYILFCFLFCFYFVLSGFLYGSEKYEKYAKSAKMNFTLKFEKNKNTENLKKP